jgi:Xaa-Pro aminopeptidase
MDRTSRRKFLSSTVAASAAGLLGSVGAAKGGARGNPFANVRDIPESQRRTPSDRYPLPFSDQEYADRLKRCREEMSKANIDLLFVTWPEGMCYLHGYEVSWYRSNAGKRWFPFTSTAVHVDHDYLLLIGSEDPAPSAAKERRVLREGGTPESMSRIHASILQKEGWLKPKTVVGLEFWSYLPNRAVSEVEESAFVEAGATVVDGSMVIRSIRTVKSPAEIATLERAARLGDIAIRAIADHFKPGMAHCEVYAEAMYAMMRQGGEVAGIAQGVQPGRPHSTHLLPSRRQIQAGEPFAVDIAGVYNRYHANVDRTFLWGNPDPELVRIDEAAKGAMEVLTKTAKAGTPLAEVNRVLQHYYTEKNIWHMHEYIGGYELGIAFAPDWVGEFVWFASDDDPPGEFKANMVTNYESNFRNEDPKYKFPLISLFRDTMVYEPGGARKLSTIPSSLIILG